MAELKKVFVSNLIYGGQQMPDCTYAQFRDIVCKLFGFCSYDLYKTCVAGTITRWIQRRPYIRGEYLVDYFNRSVNFTLTTDRDRTEKVVIEDDAPYEGVKLLEDLGIYDALDISYAYKVATEFIHNLLFVVAKRKRLINAHESEVICTAFKFNTPWIIRSKDEYMNLSLFAHDEIIGVLCSHLMNVGEKHFNITTLKQIWAFSIYLHHKRNEEYDSNVVKTPLVDVYGDIDPAKKKNKIMLCSLSNFLVNTIAFRKDKYLEMIMESNKPFKLLYILLRDEPSVRDSFLRFYPANEHFFDKVVKSCKSIRNKTFCCV